MDTNTHYVERVAHRGGAALAPENTMAAFRNALTLPVDAVELDVQMSCDGHLIVFHDNTVGRLTNGTGNILDLDFAYLRSLNAAAHFPGGWPEPQQIPTLREVLELMKGHLDIYIEIKCSKRDGVYGSYPAIAEAVVQEVRATGMIDHVLVISFDWPQLPRVKELEPRIRTGALVDKSMWNYGEKDALETLLHSAHENGFKLGLWTVNTLEAMLRFANAGVDSITSDQPDLFALLRSWRADTSEK